MFRTRFGIRVVYATSIALFLATNAFAAQWSAETHRLLIGDFNHDEQDDLLVIANDPDRYSGTVISTVESGLPEEIRQTWASNYLGVQWHSQAYEPIVGSFNEPNAITVNCQNFNYYYDDILMQRTGAGAHHVLFANHETSESVFTAVNRSFTNPNLGINWDTASHTILAGQFTTGAVDPIDYLDDFVLQPADPGDNLLLVVGQSATVYEDESQVMTAVPDGHLGFDWSSADTVLHMGDFDGDGDDAILLQGKTAPGNLTDPGQYGIVSATSLTSATVSLDTVTMSWSRSAGNPSGGTLDWSPEFHRLLVGDFNGDMLDDVFLQPKVQGADGYLVFFNGQTNPANWKVLQLPNGLAGIDWSDESVNLLVGDFDGDGKSDFYYQARLSSGTNRVISFEGLNALADEAVLTTANVTVVDASEPFLEPFVASAVTNPGSAVGYTPGEFSVSPTGAATYSIPLTLVPGIAGVQPQLGFAYNNQGSNGLLGMDWSLTGLSAIHRCPATYEQDDFADGVDLDDNDRYCLDGQRLISVASGEYRTEIDSFQRVTENGTVSGISGPSGFTVVTKARLTAVYGYLNGDATAVVKPGTSTTPLVWAVRKISDSYGNVINFEYEQPTPGHYRPKKITYGNVSSIVASVKFNYEPRFDVTSGYIAGQAIATSGRLKSIMTYVGNEGTKVREYVLEYGNLLTSGQSYLKKLTECERQTNTCKRSTDFGWTQQVRHVYPNPYTPGNQPAVLNNLQILDINNDGANDFAWTENGNWGIRLGGISGSAPSGYSPVASRDNAIVLDYNGDGYADIYQYDDTGTDLLRGGANGRLVPQTPVTYANPPVATNVDDKDITMSADFNGDGRDDRLAAGTGQASDFVSVEVYFGNSTGFETTPVKGAVQSVGDPAYFTSISPIMYDSDGIADILLKVSISPWVSRYMIYRYDRASNTLQIANDGEVFGNAHNYYITGEAGPKPKLLDHNGDGLTDLLLFSNGSSTVKLWTNTGSGFVQTWSYSTSTPQTYKLVVDDFGSWTPVMLDPSAITATRSLNANATCLKNILVNDYDGDQRSDLLFPCSATGNTWQVLVSNGSGFSTTGSVLVETGASVVNPDSAFIYGSGNNRSVAFFSASNKFSYYQYGCFCSTGGELNEITNGLGAKTTFLLGGAGGKSTDPNMGYQGHTPMINTGSNPVFPIAHSSAPLDVVLRTEVFAAHVPGSIFEAFSNIITTYSYRGLKVHRWGRGLLGFSEIRALNYQRNLETKNAYRQDFPYVGMVSEASQQIQNVEYEWANSQWDVNTTITPGPTATKTTSAFAQRNTTSVNDVVFPYVSTTTKLEYPLGNGSTPMRVTTIAYNNYDTYGNPGNISTTVTSAGGANAHTEVVSNFYNNDSTNWCLGRLQSTQTVYTRTAYGDTTTLLPATRNASFTYDTSSSSKDFCRLTSETVEPAGQWLKKAYTYDSFGNTKTTRVTGSDINERVTTTNYDAQGLFPTSVINALGHTEAQTWDKKHGVQTSVTGPNGLQTAWWYDNFGVLISEVLPQTAPNTLYSYAWCTPTYNNPQPYCAYKVAKTTSDGGWSESEFDMLGRERVTRTRAFDGGQSTPGNIVVVRDYDIVGNEFRTSLPAFESASTRCFILRKFDELGRVISEWQPAVSSSVTSPDTCNFSASDVVNPKPYADYPSGGRLTTITHDQITGNGHIWTTTNTAGRETHQVANVLDRVMNVYEFGEVHGQSGLVKIETQYDYDALGNLTWVKDAENNVTRNTFDIRGNKLTTQDPNMGNWTYVYNAVNEMVWQTDAKGTRTLQSFDLLGRMVQRIGDAQLCLSNQRYTTWVYDNTASGAAGIGKLHKAIGPYNQSAGAANSPYQETYTYDSQGRTRHVVRKIDGEYFWTSWTYDSKGRVDTTTYPASNATATASNPGTLRHAVKHNYTAYGYLRSVSQVGGTTVYWQADDVDAMGNIALSSRANGALQEHKVFDRASGLLLQTTAGTQAAPGLLQVQSYTWDGRGNLKTRTDGTYAGTTLNESFTYDSLDRLKQVTVTAPLPIGPNKTYTNDYSATGRIVNKKSSNGGDYQNYNYTGDSKPYAVNSVLANGTTRNYAYDANGNLQAGAGRTVMWSEFNMPYEIFDTNNNQSVFRYGPDRSRYSHVANKGTSQVTTLYVGGLFEKITKNSTSAVEYRHYIVAGGSVVTIHTEWSTGATPRDDYLFRDQIGSVTALTSKTGTVHDRFSYDPWGKRRVNNTWAAQSPGSFLQPSTLDRITRGFTGHEQLDHLGLIHMNGRVYDPELGRFLSADPFVQFPFSTQGLDRYAYTLNNPLSHTDPSGYGLGSLLKSAVGIVLSYFVPPLGALYFATVGYLETGSLSFAIIAGVTAYIGGNLAAGLEWGEAAFAMGLVGAVSSGFSAAALGGDVGTAMLAGAVGGALAGASFKPGAAPNVGSAIKAAVIGGTASKIGGGKFANGAAYGAFGYAVSSFAASATDLADDPDYVDPDTDLRNSVKNMGLDLREVDGVLVGEVSIHCAATNSSTCTKAIAEIRTINQNPRINIMINQVSRNSSYDIALRINGEMKDAGQYADIPRSVLVFKWRTDRTIVLNPNTMRQGTALHEFAHAIGFGHKLNSSHSITSYSSHRRLNFDDAETDELMDAYR